MSESESVHGVGELIPSIVEDTPLPIWVVDAAGTVLYANPAALTLLGYRDLADVAGCPSHALLHAFHPDGTPFPAEDCHMLDPLTTGRPTHGGEEWFFKADGSLVPVTWSSAPISLPGGGGVIHSFVDLTERQELERQTRERERAEFQRTQLKEAHLRLVSQVAAARQGIVRDLHDGAQQRLVSVILQARLIKESLGESMDSDTSRLLDGLVKDARGAVAELRELVNGIHPPVLTSHGLGAAIRSYADQSPLPVALTDELDGARLPSVLESNLYFLVAEAVTNAVKHSSATVIRIRLTQNSDGDVEVVIADDGVGGTGLSPAGSGLRGMADRVHAFDGSLHIDSPNGGGTRITATVPIGDQSFR